MTNEGYVMRLFTADVVRSAMGEHNGKKTMDIYVIPCPGMPEGATHQIIQRIPGREIQNHVVGHAVMYDTRTKTKIPLHMQPEMI